MMNIEHLPNGHYRAAPGTDADELEAYFEDLRTLGLRVDVIRDGSVWVYFKLSRNNLG